MTQPATPAIALRELRFRWRDEGAWIVDIAAFALARGEQIFLAGPSGSGKSSLLSLLAGIATAQQGELHIHGTALASLGGAARDRFRADHVGVIFQLFNLLPYLSMVENVALPCAFSTRRREVADARGGVRAEAQRLLARLGLGDAGLQSRAITELSVGQQQRVAAARALIGAPELILADEPTSALDAELRLEFVELLLRECREAGASLVFVSHDLSLAPRFTRHIALADINRARAA